jgi:hypothetical protein
MQHPRFALRAVRKRGKSIAGLPLRRDMLGRFFLTDSCPPGRHFASLRLPVRSGT